MANQTKWSISQAQSEISFKIKHLLIFHVKGVFKKFDASIYTNDNDFENAEIDLWIDTASITTHNTKRDEHLKSIDFFDSENYKQLTFTSSNFGQSDSEGNHELWGKLAMKGMSKNIKLNAQFEDIIIDNSGNEKVRVTLTGIINRSDWGLLWNTKDDNGFSEISKDVLVSCELELINAKQNDLIMDLDSVADKNENFQEGFSHQI